MLRLERLTKEYRSGDRALTGVDLDVIRCINRLVEPTAGRVVLGDEDVTRLGARGLRRARRKMGMIFQEYALVERLTVMENVLSGQLGYVGFWQSYFRRFPAAAIKEAFRLLERVGLEQFYDQRADQLSGGQRQRVGIARALIQDPKLLLVDEPTASLDPKTSRQIMRLICELCEERGLTAIINIHDVALAQLFVQRIVGLRVGEVVYDGSPDGLDADILTTIYGEEDWTAARPRARAGEEPAPVAADEERMAGMAG